LYEKIPSSVSIRSNNSFLIVILFYKKLCKFIPCSILLCLPSLLPPSSKSTSTVLGATPKNIIQPIHLHFQISDQFLLFCQRSLRDTAGSSVPFRCGDPLKGRVLQQAVILAREAALCFRKFTCCSWVTSLHVPKRNTIRRCGIAPVNYYTFLCHRVCKQQQWLRMVCSLKKSN